MVFAVVRHCAEKWDQRAKTVRWPYFFTLKESACRQSVRYYLLTGRAELSNISAITSLLAKIDEPLLIGAEMLLKAYINSISFIKAKVNEQTEGEE